MPRLQGWRDWATKFLGGICMGTADIIPGVSGGTMAFILGFYEDFIHAVKSVSPRALWRPSTLAWDFLLAIGCGIVIAFLTLAHLIHFLLNDASYRPLLYALFFGLILASVLFCAKQIPKWTTKHVVALLLGAILAYTLTGTRFDVTTKEPLYDVALVIPYSQPIQNYNTATQTLTDVPKSTLAAMLAKEVITPTTTVYSHNDQRQDTASTFVTAEHHPTINWWLVFCGAIAISAMLLPGISGSYLLTILGAYPIAIAALADFSASLKTGSPDLDALIIIGNLLVGIAIGAVVFSRVISWLLAHYHGTTIALLTGFMVGALRAVWPFWTYAYELIPLKLSRGPQLLTGEPFLPSVGDPLLWLALVFAAAGFALVLTLERSAKVA